MSEIEKQTTSEGNMQAKTGAIVSWRSFAFEHPRGMRCRSFRVLNLLLVGLAFLLPACLFSGNLFSVSAQEAEQTQGDIFQIVALGDSLTAGYGLGPEEGFVDQLQVWLDANAATEINVTNAGVSGDTTSGGLSRLAWSVLPAGEPAPDMVLLELGANDGLRGIDPALTRQNINAILEQIVARGSDVLIAGMYAPPNLGPVYERDFNSIYPDMAEKYDMILYPFFLEGVALNPALNQADGIHPTKEGVAIIVEKIGPYVLRAVEKKRTLSR